jgi:uncharacterized protein YecE (DUF72 family)
VDPRGDVSPCRLCIGTQGFSPGDWVGTFYPPGTAARDFLAFYTRVFDSVEINTTFYAVPSPRMLQGWAQRVPPSFTFSLKVPRVITHEKSLVGVEGDLSLFLDRARRLGDRLGALLVQLPPSFMRSNEDRLRSFLELLPSNMPFAIEFRHASWQDEEIYALLRQYGVAWCVSHWQALAPVVAVTADIAYVRLVGFHDDFATLGHVQRDREDELVGLATTIHELAPRLSRVYVYVNNHFEGHAPATVNRLRNLLGLPVTEPRSLWPTQPTRLPGFGV